MKSITSQIVGQITNLSAAKPARCKFDDMADEALRLLNKHGPMNYRQYSERVGITPEAAHNRFKRLHSAELIHIVKFVRRTSGPSTPIFAAGKGKDAERPAAFTNAEKVSRYMDRLKTENDGKGWKKYKAKKAKAHKLRLQTDRAYADRCRAYSANHKRRKNGHTPRIPNIAAVDPLLAAIMGIKK